MLYRFQIRNFLSIRSLIWWTFLFYLLNSFPNITLYLKFLLKKSMTFLYVHIQFHCLQRHFPLWNDTVDVLAVLGYSAGTRVHNQLVLDLDLESRSLPALLYRAFFMSVNDCSRVGEYRVLQTGIGVGYIYIIKHTKTRLYRRTERLAKILGS